MEAANLESLKQEFSISVEDVDRWVNDVKHWAATGMSYCMVFSINWYFIFHTFG